MQDEADLLVYPGFLRRPMFRWHEDGTLAPPPRVRPKAEAFQLVLPRSCIDADVAGIQLEAGQGRGAREKHRLAAIASRYGTLILFFCVGRRALMS